MMDKKATNLRWVRRVGAFAIACTTVVGCAGIKTYPNTGPTNVHIRTEVASQALLSRASADVDIFEVLPDCTLEHLGRLALESGL